MPLFGWDRMQWEQAKEAHEQVKLDMRPRSSRTNEPQDVDCIGLADETWGEQAPFRERRRCLKKNCLS